MATFKCADFLSRKENKHSNSNTHTHAHTHTHMQQQLMAFVLQNELLYKN